MTRERIKDFKEIILPFFTNYLLKENYENLGKSDAEEFEKDFKEILELAAKALEQQSEDAISRSSLLGKLDDCYKEKVKIAPDNMAEGFAQVEKLIKQEPPVTPKIKTGYWIDADTESAICSCCNRLNHLYGTYCKHCGAKMIESQGRSDKE